MATVHASIPAVLVTGGAGYIGSNAALALIDAGVDVTVLDDLSTGSHLLLPKGARFVEGRAGDQPLVARLIARHGIGAVMHFAAAISVEESMRDPARYYRENCAETAALAGCAAAAGVKAFILSSTAAVYGEGDGTPLSEDSPIAPINPYGRSKAMAETMLRDIGEASGMAVGILRYFNVAGADPDLRSGQATQHPHHLIEIATQVLTGDRDKLTIFGTDYPTPDGTAIRDYVHVRDVAEAHMRLLEHMLRTGGEATYNVGYGHGSSVREVVDTLAAVARHPVNQVEGPRRAGDPAILLADPSRLKAELGWQPRFDDLALIVRHALLWERARRALVRNRPTVLRAGGASGAQFVQGGNQRLAQIQK